MVTQVTGHMRGDGKARGPLARRSAEALLWRILTALVFAVVALLLLIPPSA